MDAPRNRGSPRLQFTKEELEDSTLSKPIAKAEKAAGKYEKAKGKLKKRYQLKLSREEMEASNVSEESRVEESCHVSPSSDDANPFEPDQEIRTDPHAPGVRNTREKPPSRQQSAQKSSNSRPNAETQSADPLNDPTHDPTKPTERTQRSGSTSGHPSKAESSIPGSEAGAKKKVYRLKFEEAQAKKPSRLSHPVQKTIKTAEDQLNRQIAAANEDDTPAPFVMNVLKEHKRDQALHRLEVGPAWNDGGFPNLVFTHPDGSHLSQPTIWKALQKVLQKAGLENHRFHDLRHTYVVNAFRAGDDVKTVQQNAGHYSAAFTLDRYAHVTETMRKESADRMQQFFNAL